LRSRLCGVLRESTWTEEPLGEAAVTGFGDTSAIGSTTAVIARLASR